MQLRISYVTEVPATSTILGNIYMIPNGNDDRTCILHVIKELIKVQCMLVLLGPVLGPWVF